MHPSGDECKNKESYEKMLEFALKDYKENISVLNSDELEDLEYEFGKILRESYKVNLKSEFSGALTGFDSYWFGEEDLDSIIELYSENSALLDLSINEKKVLVQETLNLLTTGAL